MEQVLDLYEIGFAIISEMGFRNLVELVLLEVLWNEFFFWNEMGLGI